MFESITTLSRLIRLSRHGAALRAERVLEMVLPHAHGRDQIQRLDIVHVEQTGMMKSEFCGLQITRFKIETAERDRRAIVPPVLLRKILNEMKGRIWPFR